MYAVFGATGKIGGAAAQALRQRGLGVRAIVRDANKAEPLAQNGCEIAVADVYHLDGLAAALRGASHVLVICPMNPKAEDAPAEHERMIGAIAGAIQQAKPCAIVAISDYGAHHKTGTGVALTFHRLEQRLRSIPIACTILRSAEHMQNWSRFIKQAAETGVLLTFHRPSTRLLPLVSAGDVGVIAADVLAEPGPAQVVHVEGPQRYSIDEIVNTMSITVGRPVEGREVLPENWVAALIQGGLSQSYARLLSEMYEAHNAGRIDVESEIGEVRRGKTSPAEAFAALLPGAEWSQRTSV